MPETDGSMAEKLVLIELWKLGLSREAIARFLGRRKAWVVDQLRDFPERDSK